MKQIFIFGSSNVYGVGGCDGGWADRLKRHHHHRMYADGGSGETCELYNFGKSGATVEFVQKTAPFLLDHYRRSGPVIVILSVGGNNAKAKDTPDNFVSTIEEYTKAMTGLLNDLKARSDHVIVLGYRPYDENKTMPKSDPLTGGASYFSNTRTARFGEALRKICQDMALPFIASDVPETEWIKNYLYKDGLHPNDSGYDQICDAVAQQVDVLDKGSAI